MSATAADLTVYERLADLFDYPPEGYAGRMREAREALRGRCAEAEAELDIFLSHLPADDIRAAQELHTRTFDVQAITTLDLGYVLFGDDYKRGEILANLNREHHQAGNDCRGELADHLSNVLRLLPRLKDEELILELVREIMVPALAAMIAEFDPDRIRQKDESLKKHYKTLIESSDDRKTLYRHALAAVFQAICQDFGIEDVKTDRRTGCDFLKSIETEMNIEKVELQ